MDDATASGRVAFLGLGTMGGPMAGWLAKAGCETRVWNRKPGRSAEWAARHGGHVCADPADAADGAEAVFACVGDDPDSEAVARAAFAGMAPGAIYVDHTTTSADLAVRLSGAAAASGLYWLDAPVSGGQAGAENGRLTAMCGGAAEVFARARPWLSAYCARVVHVGPAGAGQKAKMANQIAIAGIVQGLAEALALVKAEGLDPGAVFEAISQGAAGSWQMQNRWASMADGRYDFGFAVDWMRKDLRIALDAARDKGLDLELTRMVDGFYAQLQAEGGGRLDTSSLARRYQLQAGSNSAQPDGPSASNGRNTVL